MFQYLPHVKFISSEIDNKMFERIYIMSEHIWSTVALSCVVFFRLVFTVVWANRLSDKARHIENMKCKLTEEETG